MICKFENEKLIITSGESKGGYDLGDNASEMFVADTVNKNYIFFEVSPPIRIDIINDMFLFEEILFSPNKPRDLIEKIQDYIDNPPSSGSVTIGHGLTTDQNNKIVGEEGDEMLEGSLGDALTGGDGWVWDAENEKWVYDEPAKTARVLDITILDPGSGYAENDVVTLDGGNHDCRVQVVAVNEDGGMTDVTIIEDGDDSGSNGGSDYNLGSIVPVVPIGHIGEPGQFNVTEVSNANLVLNNNSIRNIGKYIVRGNLQGEQATLLMGNANDFSVEWDFDVQEKVMIFAGSAATPNFEMLSVLTFESHLEVLALSIRRIVDIGGMNDNAVDEKISETLADDDFKNMINNLIDANTPVWITDNLVQTGSDAPSAAAIKNTTGISESFVFSYLDVGRYKFTIPQLDSRSAYFAPAESFAFVEDTLYALRYSFDNDFNILIEVRKGSDGTYADGILGIGTGIFGRFKIEYILSLR